MIIDPLSKSERDQFVERALSGDPIRDWYTEIDLVISLEHAYAALDGYEAGCGLIGEKPAVGIQAK
jgi:hypothetical protein